MSAKIKHQNRRSSHHHPYKPKGISHNAFKKVYWPYIPVILAITFLLSLGSQAGAFSAVKRIPSGRVLSYATSMSIGGLLADTNASRAQNGAAPLSLNDKLDAAAQAKANDMATRNYWSHNTPEGNPPWVFVTTQGYSYQKLGENLATGFSDEQSTIDGWMASPPHRENLLDPAFTEIGFGYANNPDYTAAGGGPMTIIVAFYGEPKVLAAQSAAAPSTTPGASQSSSPASSPTEQQPSTAATAESPNSSPTKQSAVVPATTKSASITPELATKSSRVQLVLANLPIAKSATTLAILGSFLALGLWVLRHALAIRRVITYGETFAIRHPLLDIGFLVIAALFFLLTQTAGLIQ